MRSERSHDGFSPLSRLGSVVCSLFPAFNNGLFCCLSRTSRHEYHYASRIVVQVKSQVL